MEGIPGIQNIQYQEQYQQLLQAIQAYYDSGSGDEEQLAELEKQKQQYLKATGPVDQFKPAGVKAAAGEGQDAAALGGANANGGGEALINKNGTKMNAAEVGAIQDIYKKAGKSGMKPDELVNALKEKGIEAYATEVNGKKAIKFANGDTFVDTSGNGVLDTDDKEWVEATKLLKEKYGDNIPQMQGNQNANQVNALNGGDAAKAAGNDAPLLQKIANPAAGNAAIQGIGGNAQNLKATMEDLDKQLKDKGYEGDAAQDLFDKGELEQVLEQFGITMPTIGQNDSTANFVNSIFQNALKIAQTKYAA